jgi:hypothetical protein
VAARRWVLAPVLAAALLVMGAAGGVYASEGAYPDSPLYGVKLFREDIQLNMTSDRKARVQLLVRFANTRLAEARTMSQEGKDDLAVQSLLRLRSLVQQIGTNNQSGGDQADLENNLKSVDTGLTEIDQQTSTPAVRETVDQVRQDVERVEQKERDEKKDREKQEKPEPPKAGGERD